MCSGKNKTIATRYTLDSRPVRVTMTDGAIWLQSGRRMPPENLAILRHIAVNILKQERSCKLGIKSTRLKGLMGRKLHAQGF